MKRIALLIIILLLQSCNKSLVEKKDLLNEKEEDEYIEKDIDGNISIEGDLLNNQKHGIWKYYEKGKLTEVKRFYKDSLIFVLDEKDYDYEPIFLEKINYYIPIPKNWETNTYFEDQPILTSVKKCHDTHKYCPNIAITYNKNLYDSFEDFVVAGRNNTKDKYKDLIDKGFSRNSLKQEDSYVFKYYMKYEDLDLAFITIWFQDGENVIIYTASCEKSEMEKNLHLFLQIGNSMLKKK